MNNAISLAGSTQPPLERCKHSDTPDVCILQSEGRVIESVVRVEQVAHFAFLRCLHIIHSLKCATQL